SNFNIKIVYYFTNNESILINLFSKWILLIGGKKRAFEVFVIKLYFKATSAGRIAARARGRYGGRPEKLNKQDLNLLKTLYDNGTPIKTIAEQWQVSHTTIYRYLNKLEAKENKNK